MLTEKRSLLKLMLSVGLIQVAGYYIVGSLVRGDGGFAIPQTDTLLYCQAARRIVEGCPFSFSEGSAASTGTTGVLYPFLLAIPYALGLTGDSLIRAGFFLNAAFYLVFLMGWAVVIDVKIKDPFSRLVASLMIAFLGQTAYSAMSQSDIGLLLAFSSLFAASLAMDRRWLYGLLLLVFPWIRPEGDVCVLAYVLVLAWRACVLRERTSGLRRDVLVALAAVISAAGVFALNWLMTGMVGYSSLAYKGHFKTLGFCPAIFATAADMMQMAKAFLMGLPDSPPRDFYFLPVLGSLSLWAFLLLRDWKKESDWREWVWIVAFGGGWLTVAQSGWQNTNVDRYLGWLLPTLAVGMAGGLSLLATKLKSQTASWILGSLMSIFCCGMAVVHMVFFQMINRTADLLREFAVVAESHLPAKASVGAWGDCGFAYEMSPRKVCHLSGIYSMEYLVKTPPSGVLEMIKHNKDLRFDYWIINQGAPDEMDIPVEGAIGHQVVAGPAGYELLAAKWDAFDSAAITPQPPEEGVSLRSRVDVGYDLDEQASQYQIMMRYNVDPYRPFAVYAKNRGIDIVDVGRVVVGMDSLRVRLEEGKDVYVVMRTYPRKVVSVRKGSSTKPIVYEFSNPLSLTIAVDGVVGETVSIPYDPDGFSDVSFKIPGDMIRSEMPRIEFMGDHITFGYWFFQ